MKNTITFKTAMLIARYGVTPVSCWPLPVGTTTSDILLYYSRLVLTSVNPLLHIAGCIYNAYEHRRDVVRIIKIGTEVGALAAVVFKMTICQMQAPRLQKLIDEMETFLEEANREETELLQACVDKCFMTYAVVITCLIFGPVSFICGPLITSQPFPGDTAYPFSIEPIWIYVLLYVTQIISVVQVGCSVMVDIFFGNLLWYTGARFEMLFLQFQKATNDDDIAECIQQHQALIEYANQLKISTCIMAVEMVAIAMFAVTAGGFVIIGNPPMIELAKYVCFETASAAELFMLTWPANNLIEASDKIADAAWDCEWNGKSPNMRKNILFVIQRSRNPIQIAVDGLLPVLSLEFYGSTMAATFSYLTTLRAITAD